MNGDVTHLGCKKSDFEIQSSNVTTNALGSGTGNVSNYSTGAASNIAFHYPFRNRLSTYICQTKKSILYHNQGALSYVYDSGDVFKINSATIQFTPISATLLGLTLNENLKLKFYMLIKFDDNLLSSDLKIPIVTGTVNNAKIVFDPFYITTDDNYYLTNNSSQSTASFTILDITMQ